MPDIVLKDNKKVEHVYRDVQSISVPTPGGIEMATFLATSSSPVGIIAPYAGNGTYLPDGWFICNGQAVSRSEYSELFQVIGTTYGPGDGSSTFNLPNLGGRVPVGKASSGTFVTVGSTGGEEKHTLALGEMPYHEGHVLHRVGDSAGYQTEGKYLASGTLGTYGTGGRGWYVNTANEAMPASKSEGGGLAHNNLQPYITLNYIIRAK